MYEAVACYAEQNSTPLWLEIKQEDSRESGGGQLIAGQEWQNTQEWDYYFVINL